MQYCNVDDVARHLGVTSPSLINSSLTNDVVEDFIEDASGDIDDFTGRSWGERTEIEELHDSNPTGPMQGVINTYHYPIVKILKLEYFNGTWQSNFMEAPRGGGTGGYWTYSLYKDQGVIKIDDINIYGRNIFRVSYTWGSEAVPGIARRAAAAVAAIYCLVSISGTAQTFYNQNGVQIRFAGGWEYGQQVIMLQTMANNRLSRMREFMTTM
jgi:hypothetical protein